MRILQEEYAKDKHYALLKDDLHQTARALQDAYNNLENVVDPDLIDCYIYELNSVQMRYKFLLASIKKWNFHSNFRHSYRKRRGFYAKKPLDLSSSWQFSTRSPFPYVYPAYTCWVFFIIGAEESVSATLQKL